MHFQFILNLILGQGLLYLAVVIELNLKGEMRMEPPLHHSFRKDLGYFWMLRNFFKLHLWINEFVYFMALVLSNVSTITI